MITNLHEVKRIVNVKSHKIVLYYEGDTMKPKKKTISISLDYPVLEEIKALAEYEDRSVSSYINLVLREHLEQLENKQK